MSISGAVKGVPACLPEWPASMPWQEAQAVRTAVTSRPAKALILAVESLSISGPLPEDRAGMPQQPWALGRNTE
jgi:hypothetical protein